MEGRETALQEQAAQQKARRRKLAGFGVRAVCFTVITALLLSYAGYVFTSKSDYGICSMMTYYRQKPDTVDVLVAGTSMVYAGINTNILWKEYGIAAYNLCTVEEPFWIAYHTLEEALKTQHPKLILLDAKPATYAADYQKRGRVILNTFGIRDLPVRIRATLASVENPRDALGYVLKLPEVHSAYKTLALNDFILPPDNEGRGSTWKGFNEADKIDGHRTFDLSFIGARLPINAREEEYVRKIFEMTKEKGIPLMLIGMPCPNYFQDYLYYNTLWSIADEYGIPYINYNREGDRIGLDYQKDFADWNHLNVNGSVLLSRRLGKDLKEAFDLPDRRGDPAYDSWEQCAAIWKEQYPGFISSDPEANPLGW